MYNMTLNASENIIVPAPEYLRNMSEAVLAADNAYVLEKQAGFTRGGVGGRRSKHALFGVSRCIDRLFSCWLDFIYRNKYLVFSNAHQIVGMQKCRKPVVEVIILFARSLCVHTVK